MVVLLAILAFNIAMAQHLSSPRGVSIAGFTSLPNSALSFEWNPAGLIRISDWNIGISNYLDINQGNMLMQSLSFAKRISYRHSIGFKYSPGTYMEFLFPSNIVINSGGVTLKADFDKKVQYSLNYVAGYSYMLGENLSIGLSAHHYVEKITDAIYEVRGPDTASSVSLGTVEYKSNLTTFNLGLIYEIPLEWLNGEVIAGVVAENILSFKNGEIPESFRELTIRQLSGLRFGLSFKFSGQLIKNLNFGFDASTSTYTGFGFEIEPLSGLFLRGGIFSDIKRDEIVSAISTGIGLKYKIIRLDIAYLKNLSPVFKDGRITSDEFFENPVRNIEFNQFLTDRLIFSISVDAGTWIRKQISIENIELIDEIFPSSMPEYSGQPIGLISVKNISNEPVFVRMEFKIEKFMDSPVESDAYLVQPGEVVDIPVIAIFNQKIRENRVKIPVKADVRIKTSPGGYDDMAQLELIVRGRNDWDGDIASLRYFVDFENPDIIEFTRSIIWKYRDSLSKVEPKLEKFYKAMLIFNELSKLVTYVNDPTVDADRVQYPDETLKLHGGDCDDLVVLYSSLLGSLGIKTAFVDVRAVREIDESHVYILFDTEIEKIFANIISENEKRYIIMKNEAGIETVWIPVETTLVREGFEKAWEVGAMEYFNDVEINFGIIKGTVKIVPVN
jgi:hypothetical protein